MRTPICDEFGIEYPIIQAPMAGACTPALVAAVSNGGGLGSLGAAPMKRPSNTIEVIIDGIGTLRMLVIAEDEATGLTGAHLPPVCSYRNCR